MLLYKHISVAVFVFVFILVHLACLYISSVLSLKSHAISMYH